MKKIVLMDKNSYESHAIIDLASMNKILAEHSILHTQESPVLLFRYN